MHKKESMKSGMVCGPDEINIILTGDYYPYLQLERFCRENERQSFEIFGDLLPELKNADIAGINIEFPLTDSVEAIRKTGPNLKGHSVTLGPLKKAGFNLAYISNNHALDYGASGLNDTIQSLKKNGLEPLGVGNNIKEARKPCIKNLGGYTVAFINYSENEFNVAKADSPGANPLNIIQNIKDIRYANKVADYVFIIIHAGQDFNHYPPPFILDQLRFYAEEGASAIICHHSHYIAGFEKHHGVPIFYGLGNIIYPNKVDDERQKTLVVKFSINKKGLSYQVAPYFFNIDEMRLCFAGKNTQYDFTDQIEELSKTLSDYDLNEKKWFEKLKEEEYYRYLVLIGCNSHLLFRIFKKLKMLFLLDKYLSFKNKKYFHIWNLLRREVHREALLKIFEDKFKKGKKK